MAGLPAIPNPRLARRRAMREIKPVEICTGESQQCRCLSASKTGFINELERAQFAAPFYLRSKAAMKTVIWIIVIVVAAAAGYYWWQQQHPAAPPAPETPPLPAAAEPAIEHPLDDSQVSTAAANSAPLPALADSDAAAQDVLKDLFGARALALFYLNDLIRHVVVTVDNLPYEKVAQRLIPLKPAPGQFAVMTSGDDAQISPANAARYAPYVSLVDTLDAQKLVAAYLHFYPLFQQAYRELGYPKGYFNDRLIAAIDNLLATPEIAAPIKLLRPGVLYQFADPELEACSAGQKIMLRIGADNAAIVKKKLREIRSELIARETKAK